MELDLAKIKETASAELRAEKFRAAVDKEKERLRTRKTLWDRIFPYSITIVRKEHTHGLN